MLPRRWADGAPQYITDCLDILAELGIGRAWYSYRPSTSSGRAEHVEAREWYAMDLEMGTEERSPQAPRFESDLVKLIKPCFARKRQAVPGPAAPKE